MIRNLSILAYAQGFTLWHYKHNGTPSDMTSVSQWSDMIKPGDTIIISTPTGNAIRSVSPSLTLVPML